MAVTVVIPLTCRRHAGGRKRDRVNGDTVREVLEALCRKHPALTSELFGKDGMLSEYMEVYINGKSVHRYPLERAVKDEDELRIAPVVAGG